MRNAPIFLLLGTSTAGKTTISKKVQEENEKLPTTQQFDWEITGQDSWQARNDLSNGKNIDAAFHRILKDDERFEALKDKFETFPETDAAPKIRKLYFPIMTGVLNWAGESLNLLDDENFGSTLDSFIANTGGSFDRETLLNLQSLAKDKHDEFSRVPDRVNAWELMAIFDEAIENSKSGKPTIIDAVPLFADRRSAGEMLQSYMKEKGHDCQTHVAVIHLPISDLLTRMEQRNLKAEEMGKPEEVRKGFFPFAQYKDLFEAQKPDDARGKVGEVTREVLTEAVDKFGGKSSQRLAGLLDHFGFSRDAATEDEEPANLVSIYKYDSLHDSTSPESTDEIAKFILGVALKNMSAQVSYVVTPPDYEAFKADLFPLAHDDSKVIFDDEKKSVTFNLDDRDVMKYKDGLDEEKYPFFCCHPKDYDPRVVKRFENGVEKTFLEARQELVSWYHDLDEPKVAIAGNMVISEMHFDLEPKRELVKIILKSGDENTLICLENFPRSLNDLAATWLKSGDEKMPEELEEALLAQGDCYAKQLDGHDFSDEYLDQLRNSYKNILLAAKITGASVMFIENDASLTDDDFSRHAALCKTMAEISASNPDAKIIALVGDVHEEKSATQPFVLSDMIGGSSHHVRGEEFDVDFFVKDGFNHLEAGDRDSARDAFSEARKMDPDFMDKLLIQERIIAERVIGKDRVVSMGR
jgi:hypothetical protein